MPLIQGGPPEWIWERTTNLLKWELVPSPSQNGHPLLELLAQCGLEIMRLQFFTEGEIEELRAMIDEGLTQRSDDGRAEPINTPADPEAERPSERREGVVSDPDFAPQNS